jgi:hypothetical protein
MATRPETTGFATRARLRQRARARARRIRLVAVAALCAAVVLPVLILALDSASPARPLPVPVGDALLPDAAPTPRVIAFQGDLRLYLPIAEANVSALGYHAAAGALALDPVGEQANAGTFTRLVRRLFGESGSGVHYYLLGGGGGPETGALDVGAPGGTDVYAPVSGTVIGITPRVLAAETHGVRIDLQPAGSPGLVVSIQNLEPDASLSVGRTVAAARTKIGTLLDLTAAEQPALAEYTHDGGAHVHLEVRPAVNLGLS